MKLLLDMNLSPRLEMILSEAGFHVAHWSRVGRTDASDAEIMAHARANDLVVLTHDMDFSAILAATNADKPSVVQIRAVDLTPETLVRPLVIGLRHCEVAFVRAGHFADPGADDRGPSFRHRQVFGLP
jgi:predicted nuclease of predicted toxin-antitoxin system